MFLFRGCGILKRSIFETVNVERRQRTDTPCEEVEPRPERIEPKVCCVSKSLLMGHGGPVIPAWLFLSLPHEKSRYSGARLDRSIQKQCYQQRHRGFQKAAGCPDDIPVGIRSTRGIPWLAHGPLKERQPNRCRHLLSCGQLQPSASFGDGVLQPRGN